MTGKSLSLDFYPKAIYFEWKFWISRSAIHLYHSAAILESMGNKGFVFALSLPVQPHTEWEARRAKSFVCTLSDMGVLLAFKPETHVLHINSAAYTRIAFLKCRDFDVISSSIQLSQDFKVEYWRIIKYENPT